MLRPSVSYTSGPATSATLLGYSDPVLGSLLCSLDLQIIVVRYPGSHRPFFGNLADQIGFTAVVRVHELDET